MAALATDVGGKHAPVKRGAFRARVRLVSHPQHSRPTMRRTITALFLASASPAAADTVQALVSGAGPVAGGIAPVEISFLNTGAEPVRFDPPERLTADLMAGTAHRPVVLARTDTSGAVSLPAGGFVRRRYTLAVDGSVAGVLTLAGGAAFALAAAPVAAPVTAGQPMVVAESLDSAQADTGNAFLGNLLAYAPIYAVYGPGTNTDARIQISFKYQLLGSAGGRSSWIEGLHFAYTQRLFWDLGRRSSPFRNVDYNPELVYILPAPVTRERIAFGGQAGIAHLSNGRDGLASRSVNTVYIQPSATLPLGSYTLTVAPRLLAYIGSLGDNPDLARYRGHTGLFAQIGTDDGWRISTTSRINFGTGKGAIDAEVSYPLDRLVGGLNLYAFGQGFAGYGETLLDYNRRQTRLRIGLGFVR